MLRRPDSAPSFRGRQPSRGRAVQLKVVPPSASRLGFSSVRTVASTRKPGATAPVLSPGLGSTAPFPWEDAVPDGSAVISVSEEARRHATAAMLARNHNLAIEHLRTAIEQEPEGSHAWLKAIQLRCTALLRARRPAEARDDASAALAKFAEDPDAGGPQLALQSHLWQLHGIASSRTGQFDDATTSFANALKAKVSTRHSEQRQSANPTDDSGVRHSREVSALIEFFLESSALASASALPFEVYADPVSAAAKQGYRSRHGPVLGAPPAFRLNLRPRFAAWPLDIAAPTPPSRPVDNADAPRFSLFCATTGMTAEPHLCSVHHAIERHALVRRHRCRRASLVAHG